MNQKTLGIFRHGKAHTEPDEMTRPLTNEGIQWVKQVSKHINMPWDCVLSSPSERTIQTATLLSGQIPLPIDELYVNSNPTEQSLKTLIDTLQPYIDAHGRCLIVTHQPLINPLVDAFSDMPHPNTDISAGEGVLIDQSGKLAWITHDSI